MPRQARSDLSYFTLDCDIFSKKADLRPLLRKFKADGLAVYIHILCDVYGTGYYFKPDDYEGYILDVAEDCGMSEKKVQLILAFMADRTLLDAFSLNKNTVFTSHGIQKRYAEAMKGRKRSVAEIKGDYWILTEEEEAKIDTFYKSQPNSNKSEKMDDKSEKMDDKSEIYDTTEQNRNERNLLEVSKNVSREEGRDKQKRDSYEEILSRYSVGSKERKIIFEFVRHCQLNGHKLTNDAFTRALDALISYPEDRRYEVAREAIDSNRYTIKPLTEKHYDMFGFGNKTRLDYQSVMERNLKGYLDDEDVGSVISKLWEFIQHCSANGQKITNDRLRSLCCKLKKLYRPSESVEMKNAIDKAISGGYYDIKDGEGWIAESVARARALEIPLPGDDISESDDGE